MSFTHSIKYKENEIAFELKKSKRKSLTVEVRSDGCVIVKSPLAVKISLIKGIVGTKAEWILDYQAKMKERQPVSKQYISGETFTFLGRSYVLKVVPSKSIGIALEGDYLVAHVIRNTSVAVKNLIEFWYNEQSRKILAERFAKCSEEAVEHGLVFSGEFTIKKTKTRWGSCSSAGNIALNPALVYASPECIDYVIWHELCHLKEMNHGKGFYRLLESIIPDWKARKTNLNQTVNLRVEYA